MQTRGYSLIELMVVIAIIGVISAIAYPGYQGYLRDTYRGQAVADVKRCALAMDQYYSDGFTYVGATIDDDGTETCYEWSPSDAAAADAKFQLSFVSSPTRTSYSTVYPA